MRIYVRNLTGLELAFDVSPDETISRIKQLVDERKFIPAENQRLYFAGTLLSDNRTLRDCGLTEGATLQLQQRFGAAEG